MANSKRAEQIGLFSGDFQPIGKPDDAVQLGGKDSSYVVYVDESGDHGMVNVDDNYPVFILAFCIFHKKYYAEHVVPSIAKFKFRHFGHDQVVLHENEIRKATGAFNFFTGKEHHSAFINDLTTVISDANFVLCCSAIDKHKLVKMKDLPENIYHLALSHCMESLRDFLSEKNQADLRTHIVFECRGKKEDRDLELEFRRICDGANKDGAKLPFTIVLADKKANSYGLQLADLVARPIGLHSFRPQQLNRAFEVLKGKFFCEGGRKSAGIAYDGFGLKRIP